MHSVYVRKNEKSMGQQICSVALCRAVSLLLTISFLLLSVGTVQAGAQSPRQYTVRAGDTVYSISKRYGVDQETIFRLNPSARNGVKVGQVLTLSTTVATQKNVPNTVSTPSRSGATAAAAGSKGGHMHRIAPGETLYGVAKAYGVSMQELQQLNPGLSPESFSAGRTILVPGGTTKKSASLPAPSSQKRNQPPVEDENTIEDAPVRAALILPVNENGPARYIEFYEGMLIAMLELKRDGISIDLQVEQAPTTEDLKNLLRSNKLHDRAIVIGGHSEESVELLASYAAKNDLLYVSPFVWQAGRAEKYEQFFQINPPKQLLRNYLSTAFCNAFSGYQVLFVDFPGGNHTSTQDILELACKERGIKTVHRPFAELQQGEFLNTRNRPTVIVPNHSGTEQALKLVTLLEENLHKFPGGVRLFGFPEWQSGDSEFARKIGVFQATIFTTFFFDRAVAENRRFSNLYRDWYNHTIASTYPKYSVLGYDVARFFFRSMAAYGVNLNDVLYQIPTDGLQSNFIFKTISPNKCNTNISLFFVTYDAKGNTVRQSVVF